MPFLLAAAQAISLPPAEADRVVIDLTVPTPCAEAGDSGFEEEIVVCAQIDGRSPYRLGSVRDTSAATLPRAEIKLSDDTTLSAEAESEDLGMARAQRLMARVKFKF